MGLSPEFRAARFSGASSQGVRGVFQSHALALQSSHSRKGREGRYCPELDGFPSVAREWSQGAADLAVREKGQASPPGWVIKMGRDFGNHTWGS